MSCKSNKPPYNGVIQRDLGLEELLERPLHGLDLALDDAHCPFGGTISLRIMRRLSFRCCRGLSLCYFTTLSDLHTQYLKRIINHLH